MSISHPKHSLCIQREHHGVLIRLARDNLSPQEKLCLVHYLAAEGFIPDRYEALTREQLEAGAGVRWTIGYASDAAKFQTRSLRELLQVLLWACVLWLALMTFAFLGAL